MRRTLLLVAGAVYLAAVSYGGALAAAQPQATAAATATVWDGVFTGAQADRGRILYAAHCAECHGGALQGAEGKALVGDVFWMDWRESSVGDLLTYVSRNMPFSEDGSLAGTLAAGTYADIVAHILRANEFPAGAQELTASSGVAARIVRKEGSGELPASTLARVVGCLAPRGADGTWRVVKASPPERPSAAAPQAVPPAGSAGDREYALKFVLTPLTAMVGHRVSVTGLLIGDGGRDGLNVNTVQSLAPTCE